MKKYVEVANLKRVGRNGFTCNLVVNGKKAAFVAPEVFEWVNHSRRVDIMEWWKAKKGDTAPTTVETEISRLVDSQDKIWEELVPDYKRYQAQDQQAEEEIRKWIGLHYLAKKITLMNYSLISACREGKIYFGSPGRVIPEDHCILSGLSLEEIVEELEKRCIFN